MYSQGENRDGKAENNRGALWSVSARPRVNYAASAPITVGRCFITLSAFYRRLMHENHVNDFSPVRARVLHYWPFSRCLFPDIYLFRNIEFAARVRMVDGHS